MRWQKSNSSPAKVNLQEVASIDDLRFQHGTPLATERETGSGETVLADYESELESFSPKRLVPVIIQQAEVLQVSMTPTKLWIRFQKTI